MKFIRQENRLLTKRYQSCYGFATIPLAEFSEVLQQPQQHPCVEEEQH